ncbi:unnamed protein product, partial [Ectocarpus sp. 12 AP-2014]
MFDLGTNCRSCFNTCDAALTFAYEFLLTDAEIAFCPGSGITSIDDCVNSEGQRALTNNGEGLGGDAFDPMYGWEPTPAPTSVSYHFDFDEPTPTPVMVMETPQPVDARRPRPRHPEATPAPTSVSFDFDSDYPTP